MKTIRIPQGNEFSLFIPLVALSRAGVESVQTALLGELRVVVRRSNCDGEIDHTTTTDGNYIVLGFADTLPLGSYDIEVTAEYEGRDIRLAINNAFSVCRWSNLQNFPEFVAGTPQETDTQCVVGVYNTTTELEALKAEYRQKTAEAEEARARYEAALHEIQGVAQEQTSQEILEAVGGIDFTPLAKQGSNAEATNTAIYERVGDLDDIIEAINGDTIDGIINEYTDEYAEQIRAIAGVENNG